MRPPVPATRTPRKRRLQGALAGFGVAGFGWRLFFLWVQLVKFPEHLKVKLPPPQPPTLPVFPRHEHL